jgi:Uncharacterized protein conserved in bacteria
MEVKKKKKNNIINLRKKTIRCPNCKKPSINIFSPFCSKKCSDLDLMKWLKDEHFIKMETE